MSLLLDILQHILDHFIPANFQVIPVWNGRPYGCSRSIVRKIGTSLTLIPTQRIQFRVNEDVPASDYGGYTMCSTPGVLTFADALWVAEDEGELFTRFRLQCKKVQPTLKRNVPLHACPEGAEVYSDEALKKITALEEELIRLRAKIAMIITVQERGDAEEKNEQLSPEALRHLPGTPCTSLPPPQLASTPISDTGYCSGKTTKLQPVLPPQPSSLPVLIPPPPPPLPSPECRVSSSLTADAMSRTPNVKRSTGLEHTAKSKTDNVPSMMDVLKEMNRVTLRATERSPGGTPVKRKDKRASLSDPAALIADALKRKFAHTFNNDSTDTENQSFDPSSFSSPDTPRFAPQVKKLNENIFSRSDGVRQLPNVKFGRRV
ncbi:mitochondrial fission regulator 2 [Protopterus annectens]|uniref:mitochondrial fission regulator 2 n=1 Tax=Protopterus annectens TaxID=7888 RepID=UPI001CFA3F4F|nr:mitochondrial fission regulator 2 [Protopterus annectens]